MSLPIPPDSEASYTRIIDSILAASDLTTISAKRIRKGIQTAVDHDIEPYKEAINVLIMSRFDVAEEKSNAVPAEPSAPSTTTNGTKRPPTSPPSETQSHSHDTSSSPPPAKKHKKGRSVEDSDAAYAARLQAEENGRARSTRGGGAKRKTPAKGKKEKGGKKKSKKTVNSDDDSDANGTGEEKKVNRSGGFHKPMALSQPLAELLGETVLSRPQTVKKIWEYIKEHSLQDPADKRQIICDDRMRNIFRQDRVHMFTMNKILNQNLFKPEPLPAPVPIFPAHYSFPSAFGGNHFALGQPDYGPATTAATVPTCSSSFGNTGAIASPSAFQYHVYPPSAPGVSTAIPPSPTATSPVIESFSNAFGTLRLPPRELFSKGASASNAEVGSCAHAQAAEANGNHQPDAELQVIVTKPATGVPHGLM